jgi:hypothetical protein
MYLSKAMSFIKINKEDISIVETVLNPNVTYVSSSIGGPTGSKYVFNQRSSSEKVNLTRSLEFNTSVNSINEVLQRAKTSTSLNKSNYINSYMQHVFELPQNQKYQKQVEILSYTPHFGDGIEYDKKNMIKASLYNYFYKPEYPTAHYAYTNYSTLNFFSSSYFNTSSVIIYPNQLTLSSSNILSSSYLPTGSFTYNFWINPRQGFSNPGTILHFSGAIAISLATGSSRDINGNIDKFRIILQLENQACRLPSEVSDNGSTCIFTSDNSLSKDTWHHITIRWGTSEYDFGSGSILIDNIVDKTFIIPSSSLNYFISSSQDGPNCLFVGNFYEGTNSGSNGTSRFFGYDTGYQDGLDVLNADTGFTSPATSSFRFPLNAEIHDIKIYNKYLTVTEIENLYYAGPLTNDRNLLFYVPPFFTEESPYRNKSGFDGGIMVTPFYNRSGTTYSPFSAELAFEVGGHLINLENHTRELVLGKYPRLYGLSPKILTVVTSAATANSLLYLSESALKRNLTILPNDNGKFVPNFSWLQTLSSSFFRNDVTTDYSSINLSEVISSSWISSIQYNGTTSSLGYNIVGPDPRISSSLNETPLTVPSILQKTRDPSSNNIKIFEISNLYYGTRIEPNTFTLVDSAISGSDQKITITLKDDGRGNLYRANSLESNATWNSVGNIFYNEGIVVIKNPSLFWFGASQYKITFKGNSSIYTTTIDCYARPLEQISSSNSSWSDSLKATSNKNEHDTQYTLVGEVLLHDDNLNVVARASLAQPTLKKTGDALLYKIQLTF